MPGSSAPITWTIQCFEDIEGCVICGLPIVSTQLTSPVYSSALPLMAKPGIGLGGEIFIQAHPEWLTPPCQGSNMAWVTLLYGRKLTPGRNSVLKTNG